MPVPDPPEGAVEEAVRRALAEDLGEAGDLTTAALVPASIRARAWIRAEQPLVAAGVRVALRVFTALDPGVRAEHRVSDGDAVGPGGTLLQLEGPARALLSGERSALNFLGRLCGIATLTRAAVRGAAGSGVRILDTRKTTPGLRALEKHAVRCGGGENHRLGLHDMALIKENHLAVVGGITAAVRRARAALPPGTPLEVEVTDLASLEEALAAGAERVLLDNMTLEALAEAVRSAGGRAELEASGGISPGEAGVLARRTGVPRISLGALTRSAPWADVSMDLEPLRDTP